MTTRDKVSRVLLGIAFVFIGWALLDAFVLSDPEYGRQSMTYFLEAATAETGSKNLVTGIYLSYRLFDSLFEAATLFAVTAGILFMGRKDEEIR
ncbi:MAG: hypothetical protein Q7I98_02255 [Erysipelotrichaceae bacterium]|nr:hypothetical protein [Erysipelotrichaceae bacterium]